MFLIEPRAGIVNFSDHLDNSTQNFIFEIFQTTTRYAGPKNAGSAVMAGATVLDLDLFFQGARVRPFLGSGQNPGCRELAGCFIFMGTTGGSFLRDSTHYANFHGDNWWQPLPASSTGYSGLVGVHRKGETFRDSMHYANFLPPNRCPQSM